MTFVSQRIFPQAHASLRVMKNIFSSVSWWTSCVKERRENRRWGSSALAFDGEPLSWAADLDQTFEASAVTLDEKEG